MTANKKSRANKKKPKAASGPLLQAMPHGFLEAARGSEVPAAEAAQVALAVHEIAQPLIEKAPTGREQESALILATLAWNCCALPEDAQADYFDSALNEFAGLFEKSAPENLTYAMGLLIGRKASLHGSDRRIITEFCFILQNGRPKIRLAAVNP